NTFRVWGTRAGVAVMLIAILQGWTATILAYFICLSVTGPQAAAQFVNFQLALGVIAVVGHLFPLFAGFRGGKGVATLFGMILAVHFQAALVCVSVFVIVLLLIMYVFLSLIRAVFAFPCSFLFLFYPSVL